MGFSASSRRDQQVLTIPHCCQPAYAPLSMNTWFLCLELASLLIDLIFNELQSGTMAAAACSSEATRPQWSLCSPCFFLLRLASLINVIFLLPFWVKRINQTHPEVEQLFLCISPSKHIRLSSFLPCMFVFCFCPALLS